MKTAALAALALGCILTAGSLAAQAAVVITGTIDATDPTQMGRIFRDGNGSVASSPKAYPGIFNAGTSYNYSVHSITNTSATQIQVQAIFQGETNFLHIQANAPTYDPANQGTGYLGDCGNSSNSLAAPVGFSFFVPAATNFDFAVFEPTPATGGNYTITYYVSPANNAPVLDNTGTVALADIAQDVPGGSNSGSTIAALLATGASGNPITDADAGAVEGIAVTVVDNTNGAWEFTTNGGTNWTAFGTIAGGTVRLLADDANTRVRFVPSAAFTGTVATGLSFLAWDQTNGLNGELMLTYVAGTGTNMGNVGSLSVAGTLETASINVVTQQAVTVTAIAPSAGAVAGGTSVTITGTNFGASSTVTIGGNAATSVVVVNATTITCVTPAGTAGTASVEVTSNGSTNAANTLFTYANNTLPVITAASAVSVGQTQNSTATVATVSDAEDAAGSLTVTATVVPAGLTVSAITNTAGTVSANIAADNVIAIGSYVITFQVQDSLSGTATANLTVNVTAPVTGGGGGGGGDDGGCSTGNSNGNSWMLLAGLLASLAVAFRLRRARA